jgi:hypothetical protein
LNCVPSGNNGDLSAETLSGAWQLFWPQVGFAPPHRDPFLYLINLRDGLYCTVPGNPTSQRLSVSRSMVRIHHSKLRIDPPHFRNTRQSSPAGKAMEAEVGAAAVIASHSYSSLAGCPLQQFLPTFIAELNAFVRYTGSAQFAIADMPRQYGSLLVGLLSPPNLPWTDKQGDDLCSMQGGSVVLGNYCWSANEDRNGGSFPVQCDGSRVSGSIEAKCHVGVVPTRELAKTIANTKANNHTITIMIVTDFAAKMKLNSKGYLAAWKGCCVARITGNANATHPVATELRWDYLRPPQQPLQDGELPPHTVVMIVLESIYHGRHLVMKDVYEAY